MTQDNYSFQFKDEHRNINHSFAFDSGVHHYDVYRELVSFLSAVYGYDLHAEYTD
jgi:hypothetical protein